MGQDLDIAHLLLKNPNERSVLTQDGDASLFIQGLASKGHYLHVTLLDSMLRRRFELRKTTANPIDELRIGAFIEFPNLEVVMLNVVLEPKGGLH